MKKELRITGETYVDLIQTDSGIMRSCTMIPTNLGPLSIKEAAKILKIYPGTLRKRLSEYGVKDSRTIVVGSLPQVNTPKPRGKKYVDCANEELTGLGTKTRPTNLIKMPNSGTWEKDNA